MNLMNENIFDKTSLQCRQPCTFPKQEPPNRGEKHDAEVPPDLKINKTKYFRLRLYEEVR